MYKAIYRKYNLNQSYSTILKHTINNMLLFINTISLNTRYSITIILYTTIYYNNQRHTFYLEIHCLRVRSTLLIHGSALVGSFVCISRHCGECKCAVRVHTLMVAEWQLNTAWWRDRNIVLLSFICSDLEMKVVSFIIIYSLIDGKLLCYDLNVGN